MTRSNVRTWYLIIIRCLLNLSLMVVVAIQGDQVHRELSHALGVAYTCELFPLLRRFVCARFQAAACFFSCRKPLRIERVIVALLWGQANKVFWLEPSPRHLHICTQ